MFTPCLFTRRPGSGVFVFLRSRAPACINCFTCQAVMSRPRPSWAIALPSLCTVLWSRPTVFVSPPPSLHYSFLLGGILNDLAPRLQSFDVVTVRPRIPTADASDRPDMTADFPSLDAKGGHLEEATLSKAEDSVHGGRKDVRADISGAGSNSSLKGVGGHGGGTDKSDLGLLREAPRRTNPDEEGIAITVRDDRVLADCMCRLEGWVQAVGLC